MKVIIFVTLAVVALAAAAPAEPEPLKILRSQFDKQPEGSYSFNYETENGIVRSENGEVKQALDAENKPHDVVVVRGSYSYVDPEGKSVSINYFADENGYQAEGDAIPKAQ